MTNVMHLRVCRFLHTLINLPSGAFIVLWMGFLLLFWLPIWNGSLSFDCWAELKFYFKYLWIKFFIVSSALSSPTSPISLL